MKRSLFLGVLASVMLPVLSAHADVTSDMAKGLTIDVVVSNALQEGISMEKMMADINAANPEMLEAAVEAAIAADPASAEAAVAAATKANPAKAQSIVNAAAAKGADADKMVAAAIQGGADPTAVTKPTAAGSSSNLGTSSPAPSSLGTIPANVPAFGGSSGGGGGGSASPS
jgi:hypothetical protein